MSNATPTPQKPSDVTKEQFMEFVQSNGRPLRPKVLKYYEEAFKKSENRNWFVQTNWPSFFTATCWAIYRRMYVPALLYFLFVTVVCFAAFAPVRFLLSEDVANITIVSGCVLLTFVLPALYATAFYVSWAKKQIQMREITKEQFLDFIQSKNKPVDTVVLEYYEEAFKNSQSKTWFIQSNWAAFFVTSWWAVYRRMYLPVIFVYPLSVFAPGVAVGSVLSLFMYEELAASIGGFVILISLFVLPTLYGTAYYVRWAKKKIFKGKHGGTAFYRVFVGLFLSALLKLLIFMIGSEVQRQNQERMQQEQYEQYLRGY